MKYFLLIVAALFFTGCQTIYQPYARDVKRTPNQGGVIALKPDHRDEDRAKAEAMMKKNCGNAAVKIKDEGEVDIGQQTTGNAKETRDAGSDGIKLGSLFGIPVSSAGTDPSKNTSTTSTTTAVKEWQISYECGKGKAKL